MATLIQMSLWSPATLIVSAPPAAREIYFPTLQIHRDGWRVSFNAFECRLVACCDWLPSVPHRPSWRLHYDFFARDRGVKQECGRWAAPAKRAAAAAPTAQRSETRAGFVYPAVHKTSIHSYSMLLPYHLLVASDLQIIEIRAECSIPRPPLYLSCIIYMFTERTASSGEYCSNAL